MATGKVIGRIKCHHVVSNENGKSLLASSSMRLWINASACCKKNTCYELLCSDLLYEHYSHKVETESELQHFFNFQTESNRGVSSLPNPRKSLISSTSKVRTLE